jgi:hypothetical protein
VKTGKAAIRNGLRKDPYMHTLLSRKARMTK